MIFQNNKAQVAKLVDALASGASDRKVVEVRVFSWAPSLIVLIILDSLNCMQLLSALDFDEGSKFGCYNQVPYTYVTRTNGIYLLIIGRVPTDLE